MKNKIVIGAGLYGLYSALLLAKQSNTKVDVLEYDSEPFKRATYINQARVHMGYHYPRSLSTAKRSAQYFKRFVKDFGFAIHKNFEQIYATSSHFSWTNANQFQKFCDTANIRCDKINPDKYFKTNMCDGAFLTEEYTYDARRLRDYFLDELSHYTNVDIHYNIRIQKIEKIFGSGEEYFKIITNQNTFYATYIVNATYASVNKVISYLGFEPFKIKYELCEIILCNVSDLLKNVGVTVMDGPFFSIMPFGMTGMHSLTSVTFTPHMTSYKELPTFICQEENKNFCSSEMLGNCDDCEQKPKSAWPYMSGLAKKYLRPEYHFQYQKSLFSMKPILMASEIDDSRPTVIRVHSRFPTFISVLSGKINTVYDLDEVLQND